MICMVFMYTVSKHPLLKSVTLLMKKFLLKPSLMALLLASFHLGNWVRKSLTGNLQTYMLLLVFQIIVLFIAIVTLFGV